MIIYEEYFGVERGGRGKKLTVQCPLSLCDIVGDDELACFILF